MNPQSGWFRIRRGPLLNELIKRRTDLALALLIASRIKWDDSGSAEGIRKGEALLGDYEEFGFTRSEYRCSLDRLVRKHEIVTATGTARGTVVRVVDSRVFLLWGDDAQATKPGGTRAEDNSQQYSHQPVRTQPPVQPPGERPQVAASVSVAGFTETGKRHLNSHPTGELPPSEPPLSRQVKTKDGGSVPTQQAGLAEDGRPGKTQDTRRETEDQNGRRRPPLFPKDIKIPLQEVRNILAGLKRYHFGDKDSRLRERFPAEFDEYKRLKERERLLSTQLTTLDFFPNRPSRTT